jgi:hypothetical protein
MRGASPEWAWPPAPDLCFGLLFVHGLPRSRAHERRADDRLRRVHRESRRRRWRDGRRRGRLDVPAGESGSRRRCLHVRSRASWLCGVPSAGPGPERRRRPERVPGRVLCEPAGGEHLLRAGRVQLPAVPRSRRRGPSVHLPALTQVTGPIDRSHRRGAERTGVASGSGGTSAILAMRAPGLRGARGRQVTGLSAWHERCSSLGV